MIPSSSKTKHEVAVSVGFLGICAEQSYLGYCCSKFLPSILNKSQCFASRLTFRGIKSIFKKRHRAKRTWDKGSLWDQCGQQNHKKNIFADHTPLST